MAFGNDALNNFAAGELSPRLRGRFDLPIYRTGLKRMSNFIAETQGSARFRQGFGFIYHTRANQPATLLTFQFGNNQSYVLEFTNQMLRFYRDGGIIVEAAKTITGATQANPVVVTSTSHGYSNGDEVIISGVSGTTELNGKSFLVASVTANTFALQDIDGNNIDGTAFTAYSSGGQATRVYEIATPYLTAELFELDVAGNADVMYIVHANHAPRKLTRVADTNWTLATFVRTADPFPSAGNFPGAVAFYEGRLGYAGTDNSPETFWLSRSPDNSGNPRYDDFTTGTADDNAVIFTLAPVQGKVDSVRWLRGTSQFLAVGTFGGMTKVQGGRSDQPIAPTGISVKTIDAFGVEDRRPISTGSVIIYIQNGGLILRSLEYDFNFDGFVSIDRNLVADHITDSSINQIAFQNGRPDILWGVRNDGVLTGLTFKSREDVSGWHRHTLGGTNAKSLSVATIPQPNKHDQVWVVAERTINSLTRRYVELLPDEMSYPEPLDFFTDASSQSSDITTFKNAMYEEQKMYTHLDSYLTFNGSARGSAASATLTPGAVTGTSITFTASASVFSSSDVGNELWGKYVNGVGGGRAKIITFNSATEVVCDITKDFNSTNAIAAGNWFITAGSISGLEHLEGEVVGVVTDGSVHPDKTVSNGTVILDYQASVVHVGLKYSGLIQTMNLEQGGEVGPSQTRFRNISEVGIRFLNTLGARFGTNVYNLERILFRSTADVMNRPPLLFSGIKRVKLPQDSYTEEKEVIVQQTSPLPCTVQMLDIFADTVNE